MEHENEGGGSIMHIRKFIQVFLIVIAILLFAAIANAEECYEWVDDKGVTHFSDSVDLVPEQYRSTMKPCGTTSGPGLSVIKEDKETEPKAAEPQDKLGRTREDWAKRIAEARERLRLAEDEYQRLWIEYREAVRKYDEATSTGDKDEYTELKGSLQAQMTQQSLEINKAREYLDVTLPKEAEQDGAPAEWLK
jgi:ribosome-binding protein aMBF1 (putative translation factor)